MAADRPGGVEGAAGPLRLDRRAEALAEAWHVRRSGSARQLETLLAGLEPELFQLEPELAYLYGTLLQRSARWDRAAEYLDILDRAAKTRGTPRLQFLSHHAQALVLQSRGDLAGAEKSLMRAWSSASLHPDDQSLGQLSLSIAVIQALRGDFDRALQGFRYAHVLVQRGGDLDSAILFHNNVAHLYLESGRAAHAVPHVDEGLAMALEVDRNVSLLRTTQAAVWLELGDLDFAEAVLRRALDEPWLSGRRGEAMRVLAAVLERRGDLSAAAVPLDAALGTARELGDPILEAQCQELNARILRRRGEAEAAEAAVAEAVRLYRAIGSEARADAARRAVRDTP